MDLSPRQTKPRHPRNPMTLSPSIILMWPAAQQKRSQVAISVQLVNTAWRLRLEIELLSWQTNKSMVSLLSLSQQKLWKIPWVKPKDPNKALGKLAIKSPSAWQTLVTTRTVSSIKRATNQAKRTKFCPSTPANCSQNPCQKSQLHPVTMSFLNRERKNES